MSELEEVTVEQAGVALESSRRISDDAPPSIPNYRLARLLGQGSFGSVWSAVQLRTEQWVAVKVLHRPAQGWEGFVREVATLRQVAEHPGVITLLDADLQYNPPYFVMPWLRQGSLADLPARPTLARAVQWLREAALALSYTHEKGILHCDLKPSNLLLDDQYRIRLVDFGQSLLQDVAGRSLGTLGYMPPEQAAPESLPDVRWDVYSLGATAYFLLTGVIPRLSESDRVSLSSGSVEQKIQLYRELLLSRVLTPVRSLNPRVDTDLACIIERSLEIEPGKRTPSMYPLLADLDHRDRGEPLLCRRPWSLAYRLRKWVQRPVVAATLLGALALTGLGITSWRQIESKNSELEASNQRLGQANRSLVEQGITLKWEAGIQSERQGRPDTALLGWTSLLQELPDEPGLRLLLGTSHRYPLRWREPIVWEPSSLPDSLRPPGLLRYSLDGTQIAYTLPYSEKSRVECRTASSGALQWRTEGSLVALEAGPDRRFLLTFPGRLEVRHDAVGYRLGGHAQAAALVDKGEVEVLSDSGVWQHWVPERSHLALGGVTSYPHPLTIGRSLADVNPDFSCLQVTPDRRFSLWLDRSHWKIGLMDGSGRRLKSWSIAPCQRSLLSNDGRRLITVTRTEVICWNVGTAKVVWRMGIEAPPTALHFDPAGELLLIGGEGWARVVDRHGRTVGGPFSTLLTTAAAEFSPAGDGLALLSSDGQLEVRGLTRSVDWLTDRPTTAVGWGPTGQLSGAHPPSQVDTWQGRQQKWSVRVKSGYPTGLVTHVDGLHWTRDGRTLAVSAAMSGVRENRWDRSMGQYFLDPQGRQDLARQPYRVSPDGRFELVNGKHAKGFYLKPRQPGLTSPLLGVALPDGRAVWSLDGSHFAIVTPDRLSLWTVASDRPVWASPFDGGVGWLALSPTGAWLACARRNQVHLYAVGGQRTDLNTGTARTGAGWFSPDANYLLVGTVDGRVLRTLVHHPERWSQLGEDEVNTLAFHPRRSWVALSGPAGVRVYDLASLRPISALAPGIAEAGALAFDSTGQTLAVGCPQGMGLWKLVSEVGPAPSIVRQLRHDLGLKRDQEGQLLLESTVPP
ncbi:protein kinase [bacterium]|nr:protein kinase [bacterium]